MKSYQGILQYDGSDRLGFMHHEGTATIQGDLNDALRKILAGEFTTRAASRTDKGVHALAQTIKISTEDPTPLDAAQLNSVLPPHMRCLALAPCPREFIPSIDQKDKEYRYLFASLPAEHRYIAQAPALDIEAMKACVALLTGTNNFKNFWSIGGISNTTVREISVCELSEINPQELFAGTLFSAGEVTRVWQFRIKGTGFLKHMVRHLVGALYEVGKGKLTVQDFERYLYGEQKTQRPWKKADPRGLFLFKVSYE